MLRHALRQLKVGNATVASHALFSVAVLEFHRVLAHGSLQMKMVGRLAPVAEEDLDVEFLILHALLIVEGLVKVFLVVGGHELDSAQVHK